MMTMRENSRQPGYATISRKEAQPMEELVRGYIREMKLSAGLSRQRVFHTWDAVTGAGSMTIGKFFKDGTLYCTLSSSVLRSQLFLQREEILRRMNALLQEDPLFDAAAGGYVRKLVLK